MFGCHQFGRQSVLCAGTAASHSSTVRRAERSRQDAARSRAGQEARTLPHPVPRISPGAGDRENEEACSVGARGGTNSRRARPVPGGRVSDCGCNDRSDTVMGELNKTAITAVGVNAATVKESRFLPWGQLKNTAGMSRIFWIVLPSFD